MTDPELRATQDAIFSARDRESMTPAIAAFTGSLEQHPNDANVLCKEGGAYDSNGQDAVGAAPIADHARGRQAHRREDEVLGYEVALRGTSANLDSLDVKGSQNRLGAPVAS